MIWQESVGPKSQTRTGRLRKLVLMPDIKIKAHFIELSQPQLEPATERACRLTNYQLDSTVPPPWRLRAGGRVQLRSCNDKDFNVRCLLNKSLGMLHACAVILLRRCEMGF